MEVQRGDDEAAAGYFRRALEIRIEIVRLEPSAGYWQRELIVPHWRLADLAVARDSSLDEAKRHYQAAYEIARTLADSNRLAPTDSGSSKSSRPGLSR